MTKITDAVDPVDEVEDESLEENEEATATVVDESVSDVEDVRRQEYIDALLFERAGYERRGLTDRVDQVNEQLRLRGYEDPARTVAAPAAEARGRRTAKG